MDEDDVLESFFECLRDACGMKKQRELNRKVYEKALLRVGVGDRMYVCMVKTEHDTTRLDKKYSRARS